MLEAVTTAVRTLSESVSVVGHSGAGAFLPAIGSAVGGKLAGLIFVDALVPPANRPYSPSQEMNVLLDSVTDGNHLLPWLEWWPPKVVELFLPDPADRHLLTSDMPTVPRSFYDRPITNPSGWTEGHCGYLQLSQTYRPEREQASKWDWPTVSIDANHLSIVTQPRVIMTSVQVLLDEF